jgi:hypothetical protein
MEREKDANSRISAGWLNFLIFALNSDRALWIVRGHRTLMIYLFFAAPIKLLDDVLIRNGLDNH